MRYILPLVFILLLAPQSLRAEYFLKGKVISVDREKGEITLAALSARQCDASCPAEQTGRQDDGSTPPAAKELYVVSSDFIPPCVTADAVISVWGELTSGSGEKRLFARRIMGPGGGRHGRDSTGVRNRLRNRCWMKGGGPPGNLPSGEP